MDDPPSGSLGDSTGFNTGPEIYSNIITNIRMLSHPISCLVHIMFKLAILASYIIFPYIIGLFTGIIPDFIIVFALISLLVFVDFWAVKNYTSTTIAGIAWYYHIKDNGAYTAINKRIKEEVFLNKTETQYFWVVLYIWPTLWALNILFKLTMFNFPPLVLSTIIFLGGFLNLYNCIYCSQDKREKFISLHNKFTNLMESKF
ncbi:hypothetical protein BEWA_034220 [Theileria equi strain WA]|uniref:Golgi apparatus membrane protein TVP23 homolog n=1 Tax=Theileria equi strain WA TaxID=1537102 RepID=L0AZY6_THEEQ|nr:hypothetical protein BEWA_034220 [Theileria equi strain WA]AFZ80566.1 hypothetical protein BEWA_034220 [Theileria equi strain WA]|eukprot:XP_004830232.1 hypothetical protein BEWA_034220 [Theileria equi strain WA]